MSTAIYPGSFDPMTNGHIDVIKKALKLFDVIYIVVAINPEKKHMFNIEERTKISILSLKDLNIPEGKKVVLVPYKGIVSNLAIELKVKAVIRGMRNAHDMQDEYAIEQFTEASTNKKVLTTYFSPSPKHIFTSSTLVRNFIKGGFSSKAKKYVNKKAYKYMIKKADKKPIMSDFKYKLIEIN